MDRTFRWIVYGKEREGGVKGLISRFLVFIPDIYIYISISIYIDIDYNTVR